MAVKDGMPATDFSRQNREWVKAVAGGGSGGGGLPEITADDEGKVLTVESGAAAWATAGGGGGGSIMIVNESSDGSALVLDKTYNEIKNAMTAGTIVIISRVYSEEDYYSYENFVASVYDQATPGLGREYSVCIYTGGETVTYFTYDADGYPEVAL